MQGELQNRIRFNAAVVVPVRKKHQLYLGPWYSCLDSLFIDFFLEILLRTFVLFVGRLIPLFWTSGDIYPWIQSQSGSPCLQASSPICNRFLRLTSGATPADLAAELFFDPLTYTHKGIGGVRVPFYGHVDEMRKPFRQQDWYFVIRKDSRLHLNTWLVKTGELLSDHLVLRMKHRSRWRNYSSFDRHVTNTLSALLRRFSVINLSILQVWFYTSAYRIVLLAECSSNVQVL